MDGIRHGRIIIHLPSPSGQGGPNPEGGIPQPGAGFHTIKCDPRFVRRKLGRYSRAWLRWLDIEGATSAVPGALLPARMCLPPDGHGGRPQWLSEAHTRWHTWRRGESALVGAAGPLPRLVGPLAVRVGGGPLLRRPGLLRRGGQRGAAVVHCPGRHGVGVESCVPERHLSRGASQTEILVRRRSLGEG